MELDLEPPVDPDEEPPLMSDEQFDEEVQIAAAGGWAELGLDEPGAHRDPAALPSGAGVPVSIDEFLNEAPGG